MLPTRKLILATAALMVSLAAPQAYAKPALPNGPIMGPPKANILPKNPKLVIPKGPIKVKPPIIVTPKPPKFPKKPPVVIVTPAFPHPVVTPVVSQVLVERPVTVARPVVASTCNCLTKEYTQDGQVVFKDLCTKEAAAAPVAGVEEQKTGAADTSTNFAGKTYKDYLAANSTAQQN